jgi:rod shape-determining protein MreD
VWVAGLVFTLLKGRLMHTVGFHSLDLDLLIVVIVYLLTRYGHTASCAFAFGQGLFIDVLSGGTRGFFTLIYLAVFWGLHFGSRFFDPESTRGQMILVALVLLLKKCLFFGLLVLFVPHVAVPRSFPIMIGGSMLITALSAPLFFMFFDYLLALSPVDDELPG